MLSLSLFLKNVDGCHIWESINCVYRIWNMSYMQLLCCRDFSKSQVRKGKKNLYEFSARNTASLNKIF